jgi:chloramphenicol 3-O phosphotransferase
MSGTGWSSNHEGRRIRVRHTWPMEKTGSVIILNGPSSSGKTTLAAALQRRFAAAGECWFVYAMDDYFAKVPFEWVQAGTHVGPHADQGVVLEIVDGAFRMRMGPIGRQVLVAWRGAVASAVRAGLNVIADDVILTEQEWRGWQDELEGLDTHWVRVQIALDVLEAREQARGNRMVGQARAQYEDSYRFPVYDAEVDTGTLEPDAAADAVLAGWRDRTI